MFSLGLLGVDDFMSVAELINKNLDSIKINQFGRRIFFKDKDSVDNFLHLCTLSKDWRLKEISHNLFERIQRNHDFRRIE